MEHGTKDGRIMEQEHGMKEHGRNMEGMKVEYIKEHGSKRRSWTEARKQRRKGRRMEHEKKNRTWIKGSNEHRRKEGIWKEGMWKVSFHPSFPPALSRKTFLLCYFVSSSISFFSALFPIYLLLLCSINAL